MQWVVSPSQPGGAGGFGGAGLGDFVFVAVRSRDGGPVYADEVRDGELRPHLRQHMHKLRPTQQHPRLAIIQDVDQFTRHQPPVQRRKNRPDFG